MIMCVCLYTSSCVTCCVRPAGSDDNLLDSIIRRSGETVPREQLHPDLLLGQDHLYQGQEAHQNLLGNPSKDGHKNFLVWQSGDRTQRTFVCISKEFSGTGSSQVPIKIS
jgi:hypothetical protein